MPLETLMINGVGGIGHLSLELDPHLNILCGPNGIGKTSVIECVAATFRFGPSGRVKRHALHTEGNVQVVGVLGPHKVLARLNFKDFAPDETEHLAGQHTIAHWVLYMGTARDVNYSKLSSILSDPTVTDSRNRAYQNSLVELGDIKNWFIQRFLYSAHAGTLASQQLANLAQAKTVFERLQEGFSFRTIDAKRSEIMISTPTGVLPFEYLSSGFRSCVALIFGIIKEIEHRFPPEESEARSFAGVIMIDEVELHLHPDWQRKICGLLRECFPAAQFIVTTHSPHVIQTADVSSIFALRQLGEGRLEKAALSSSPFGFQGWTIEEILTDVMGMSNTMSDDLSVAMTEFSNAVRARQMAAATTASEKLNQMLHPGSTVRKIIQLQMADFEADHD